MFSGNRWCSKFKTLSVAAMLLLMGLSAAQAAPPEKTIRVGILLSGSVQQWAHLENAIVAGLSDHGYIEGKNLIVVRRYGELEGERIERFAQELAAMNLDAIVTTCTGTTRRAKAAAASTPIVMAGAPDPVGEGLVKSLARPGTNVTGRSTQTSELQPKRLELLRSAFPEGAQIAVLMNSRNPVHEVLWREAEASAQSLNMKLVRIETRGAAGLDGAFDNLAKSGARAILVLSDDPTMIEFRDQIVAAATRLDLPSMFGYRESVEAGGLMSYGPNLHDDYRLSAAYVVKVANGANPAELPIEQPTQFELVINLKTAAALGITLPRALLLRADELIR